VTYSHEPPVIVDGGNWRLDNNQLVLDFKGNSRPADAKHVALAFVMFDENTLIVRGSNGVVNIFQRDK
jgi:hypothetical protein